MTEAKGGAEMAAEVPDAARQMAGRLAEAFERDRGLAEQLNDCQDRLQAANDQLWSGLHPDALGLLYDDTTAVGVRQGASVIAGAMVDALRSGGSEADVEASVLPGLQEVHWTIHRAFSEHQRISEDRRHLAAEIGELIAQFTAELIAGGWSEEQARNADVHHLAAAAAQ
ncbi:MAG: hypothetical protein ACR2IP_00665 [Solirubrobacteraceae bacterium]